MRTAGSALSCCPPTPRLCRRPGRRCRRPVAPASWRGHTRGSAIRGGGEQGPSLGGSLPGLRVCTGRSGQPPPRVGRAGQWPPWGPARQQLRDPLLGAEKSSECPQSPRELFKPLDQPPALSPVRTAGSVFARGPGRCGGLGGREPRGGSAFAVTSCLLLGRASVSRRGGLCSYSSFDGRRSAPSTPERLPLISALNP